MEDLIRYFLFQAPRPCSIPRKFVLIETKLKCLIPVCYISCPNAKKTILYSHGNAEDLARICNYLEDLSRILNVNIICYDYSGYGLSKPGKDFHNHYKTFGPSEDRCYADIEAVYNFITKGKRLSPNDIILYGRSLGSGPSCYLAQKLSKQGVQLGGLILHSPFMSVYRIVLPFSILGDKFMNIDRIPDIACPIFLIHGTVDLVVPFSHGQAIQGSVQDRYRTTPFWAEDIGHNDIEVNMAGEFIRRLHDFFDYINMNDLFDYKKTILLKKQAEIAMLKKIISKKAHYSSINKKVKVNTDVKLVESVEDRHENEQKDHVFKSSRINNSDLNLFKPKLSTCQVSITVEEGKVEVLNESEVLRKEKGFVYYDEYPYEPTKMKSTKECGKFSSLETMRSRECRV